jgi:four helix bundle protein
VREGSSKPYNLRERTFIFARRILDITAQLPKVTEGDVIRTQLVKSGTSIGANTEEADGASTKRDFRNKISIARKEAKETHYWLRLVSGKFIPTEEISGDIQEVHELIRIMSTILDKTKR